jgi:hypothetical protein
MGQARTTTMRTLVSRTLFFVGAMLAAPACDAASDHVYRVTLSMPRTSKPFAELVCSSGRECTVNQPILAAWGPTAAKYTLDLDRNGNIIYLNATAQGCRFSIKKIGPIPLNMPAKAEMHQDVCGAIVQSEPPVFQYSVFVFVECADCGNAPSNIRRND